MKVAVAALTAAALLSSGCGSRNIGDEAVGVTLYSGASWYDGTNFIARDAYVKNGVFVRKPRGEVSDVRDLSGAFVVPGFADGHHHTVLCSPGRIDQFRRAGILYVGVMNARVSSRACQARLHPASGVEVVSALAGLTARNAHPSQIGEYFLEPDEIDGEWVHYVDSLDELDRKWPAIVGTRPDLLKIFVSYSEDFAALKEDASLASWYRGLDPALVGPIVNRAHRAGLRVAAHVMTGHDFKVAVAGGADIIAHMPGFAPGAAFTENDSHPYLAAAANDPGKYTIAHEDAEAAARKGIAVITTVSGGEGPPSEAILENFETIQAAGAKLLIGSDRGEFSSVDEFEYLVSHHLLTSRDALHSLSVETPRALFPNRPIGALQPGYEASFVVLDNNPLDVPEAVRQVRLVIKRGEGAPPAGGAVAK